MEVRPHSRVFHQPTAYERLASRRVALVSLRLVVRDDGACLLILRLLLVFATATGRG
jgi:hypothetical protein